MKRKEVMQTCMHVCMYSDIRKTVSSLFGEQAREQRRQNCFDLFRRTFSSSDPHIRICTPLRTPTRLDGGSAHRYTLKEEMAIEGSHMYFVSACARRRILGFQAVRKRRLGKKDILRAKWLGERREDWDEPESEGREGQEGWIGS